MPIFIRNAARRARRIVIAVVGFAVLFAGVAMIALPGPAIIVIPIGLGLLAVEFDWARRLLARVKDEISKRKKTRSETNTRG